MILLEKYLLENNIKDGTYAIVTYNNKTEPTWFTKYISNKRTWFLESPCVLRKVEDINQPIDKFTKEYVEGRLEKGEDANDYIEKYVKPMIIDNILYEIENYQCSPYLPKEVDDIKLIKERECLEYMLNKEKNKELGIQY